MFVVKTHQLCEHRIALIAEPLRTRRELARLRLGHLPRLPHGDNRSMRPLTRVNSCESRCRASARSRPAPPPRSGQIYEVRGRGEAHTGHADLCSRSLQPRTASASSSASALAVSSALRLSWPTLLPPLPACSRTRCPPRADSRELTQRSREVAGGDMWRGCSLLHLPPKPFRCALKLSPHRVYQPCHQHHAATTVPPPPCRHLHTPPATLLPRHHTHHATPTLDTLTRDDQTTPFHWGSATASWQSDAGHQ